MEFTVLLWALVCSIVHQSQGYECDWKTPNATFNLCELQLSKSTNNNKTYYEAFDIYNKQNKASVSYNFTYIFNVCNNIESQPPEEICWNNTLRALPINPMATGYCPQSEINATDGECIEIQDIIQTTAAYQIHWSKDKETECYRMHNGIDEPVFSYINPDDPASGVRLTYINGDWCETAQRNREFSLEFYCSETAAKLPNTKEQIVYENEECAYRLPIYTSYGCPVECAQSPTSNTICDANGVCEFDFTVMKPRCYCYYGYCGEDCSQTGAACTSHDTLYTNETTFNNDPDECLFALTDSFGITAYYNLSYFNLQGENFIVDDAKDREYVYKFNICSDLEQVDNDTQIPTSCKNYNHGTCTHYAEDGSCNNVYDTFDSQSKPQAVQIYYPQNNKSEAECYWLGSDLPDAFRMQSYDVSLIDPNDAGRGIVFRILNGEYCASSNTNRELNVMLRCQDTQISEFDPYHEAKAIIKESVDESVTCVYDIEFESPLACPDQCISEGKKAATFAVCSSHGICVSDPKAKRVRCVCDDGYMGMVCDKRVHDVTTTAAVIHHERGIHDKNIWGVVIGVCILVVVVMVVAGYCYSQRKQRLAINQYGNLSHLQADALINE